MNIYDISKEAGVSIATVSRVLNNSKNVSKKTRAKIQAIIAANDFKATKPGKKKRRNRIVGILCNSLSSTRTAKITEELTGKLNKLGYQVLLSCADNISDRKIALSRLIDSNPTTIIIEGTDFLAYDNADNNYILQGAENVPIIILNSYMEHSNIHSIVCDEGSLIFSLTEEYIKQGKTQVLFLFSSMSSYSAPLLSAFNHAYFVHNVETTPWQQHLCIRSFEDGYKYVETLIKTEKRIDALIATDDIIAAGAKKALLDNGILVPTEVDVIGMGNTALAKAFDFPSINCKENEIISSALKTFEGIINKTHTPSRVTLPAEIKKRRTT